MGMRYTTRLYKPKEKIDIATAVLNAAAKIGADARPSKDAEDTSLLRIGEREGVYTADLPYCDGDFQFFRQLAMELGSVWLEARIQEGSHWDYSLYRGGRSLDEFSTLPQYWNGDDELLALSMEGRPKLLAKAWNLPHDSIERYIRQWGMRYIDEDTYETVLNGNAYPTDRLSTANTTSFSIFSKSSTTPTHRPVFLSFVFPSADQSNTPAGASFLVTG